MKASAILATQDCTERAHATVGSQEMVVAAVISQGDLAACERCSWQGVTCIQTGDGTRCMNCHDKHMGCSFVPAKDGEGASLGVQHAKPSAGPHTKATPKGASGDKGADRLGGIKSGTS